jgi:hypothetical protein
MKTLEERLASYRAAFLEKVKRWNWDDEGDIPRCKRGRKAQVRVRIESKPRTPSERKVVQQKYNWL